VAGKQRGEESSYVRTLIESVDAAALSLSDHFTLLLASLPEQFIFPTRIFLFLTFLLTLTGIWVSRLKTISIFLSFFLASFLDILI
jgi:hypothetical protein